MSMLLTFFDKEMLYVCVQMYFKNRHQVSVRNNCKWSKLKKKRKKKKKVNIYVA